ncbi:MAG: preprotein translocase subunit SecG [Rhodospirillaceae bacterium]|nr:preprotein translocase subunit SecG [Rhodospirillaceae bacterium]
MQEVLLVIHLLIAISLIGVILVQRNEGGAGLSGLGGGGGGGAGGMAGFMTGRGQANLLTRLTAGLVVAFFVTSITLGILASGASERPSLFDQLQLPTGTTTDEPATGEEPAAADSVPAEPESDAPSVPVSE